jgi:outer membrane biosynthesis protein TonB
MATATLRHWQSATHSRSLQAAVVFSAVVHLSLFVFTVTNWRPPAPKAIPNSFEVNFAAPPTPEPDPESKAVAPAPPAPKPEPPKPEPKKEEPKPEPKKEEPKPEPKKEPEKVAEKKPEPKPEPKKEPEKKPEPKKEPPKKEPEKKPETKPTSGAPTTLPTPEVVAKAPPESSGVQQQQLPSILNAWGRQVHRKIYSKWMPPGGVQLTPEQREVRVSFWVGRNGMLLSQPTVVQGTNEALAQSGITAIINAQPLPPLPIEFSAERQEVIYVFRMTDTVATDAGGGVG